MSMELCDIGHDQIAYTCKSCPLCEQIAVTSAMEGERDELVKKVDELESQLESAREDYGKLAAELGG